MAKGKKTKLDNFLEEWRKDHKKSKKHIGKTHDGTSLGVLRGSLNYFIEKFGKDSEQNIMVMEADGSTRAELYRPSDEHESLDINFEEEFGNAKDYHLIKNPDFDNWDDLHDYGFYYDGGNGSWEESFTPMTKDDMLDLLSKNNDGDYIFQSSTLTSNGGGYMSLLRNNDFSKSDEKRFKEVVKEFQNDVQKSDWSKKADKIFDEIQDEHEHDLPINELYVELGKRMKKETGYGTLREYLASRDYESKFKDCNVRFVMRKS